MKLTSSIPLRLMPRQGRDYTENILFNSGSPVENTNYLLAEYPLAYAPADGEEMTVTLWGMLGQGQKYFQLYNSSGSVGVVRLTDAYLVEPGVWRATFLWNSTTSSGSTVAGINTTLRVYVYTSAVTAPSRVDRIKLERGSNEQTVWTPPHPRVALAANGDLKIDSVKAANLLPTVSASGKWMVNGSDTGIAAQGPQGVKGDKGDTGLQGPKGDKGDKGDKGEDSRASMLGLRDFLKVNELKAGAAEMMEDGFGEEYVRADAYLIYSAYTNNESADIFGMRFKPGVRYCIKGSADADGITTSVCTTFSIGFQYTDGTTSGILIWNKSTSKTEGELVSAAGKDVARVYVTYGSGRYLNIRAISLTEGVEMPSGYPWSKADISGLTYKPSFADGKITFLPSYDRLPAVLDKVASTDTTDALATGLAKKADSSAIPTKVSQLTNDSLYQTATQVNSAITGKGYQTASQVNSIIDGKGFSTFDGAWDSLTGRPTTVATLGLTDLKIASGAITIGTSSITPLTSASSIAWSKVTGRPTSLSGYGITDSYTKTDIDNKGYQTATQVNSIIDGKGYQTASQVDTAITGKGYQTASQVNSIITGKGFALATDLANKADTSSIPTLVSQLTDDRGLISVDQAGTGVNLLANTRTWGAGWTMTSTVETAAIDRKTILGLDDIHIVGPKANTTSANSNIAYQSLQQWKAGCVYVLSFWARSEQAEASLAVYILNSGKMSVFGCTNGQDLPFGNTGTSNITVEFPVTNIWRRHYMIFKVESLSASAPRLYFRVPTAGFRDFVAAPKLEEGPIPTSWSPAPGDADIVTRIGQTDFDSLMATNMTLSDSLATARSDISDLQTARDNLMKADAAMNKSIQAVATASAELQEGLANKADLSAIPKAISQLTDDRGLISVDQAIAGVNLLPNTRTWGTGWTKLSTTEVAAFEQKTILGLDDVMCAQMKAASTTSNTNIAYCTLGKWEAGDVYALSFWARSEQAEASLALYIMYPGIIQITDCTNGQGLPFGNTAQSSMTVNFPVTDEWRRHYMVFKVTTPYTSSLTPKIYFRAPTAGFRFFVAAPKLERGLIPTVWSSAPDDTDKAWKMSQADFENLMDTNMTLRDDLAAAQGHITQLQTKLAATERTMALSGRGSLHFDSLTSSTLTSLTPFETSTSSAKHITDSTIKIVYYRKYNTFVVQDTASGTYYPNCPGLDAYGTAGTNGRTPIKDQAYHTDTAAYYYDGSKLVAVS